MSDWQEASYQSQSDWAIARAESEARSYKAELDLVYASWSWRLTKPFRWFVVQLVRVRDRGVRTRLVALYKKLLKKIMGPSWVRQQRRDMTEQAQRLSDELYRVVAGKRRS